jgi:hypothetical protein
MAQPMYAQNDPADMTEEQLIQLQNATPPPADYSPMEEAGLNNYLMAPQESLQPITPQALQAQQAMDNAPSPKATTQLEKYIQDFANKKAKIDYSPLAAYVDATMGGNLTKAAESARGLTEDQKAEKLVQLQNMLAERQNAQDKAKAAMALAEANNEFKKSRLGLAQQSMENQKTRIGINQDKVAQSLAGKFDTDPILLMVTKQRQQAALDKHTLDTVDILTPQIFNEVQQGVANMISGGRTAAVTTTNKNEFASVQLDYTRLMQRIKNKPEDINSPEVKKMLYNTISRLDEAYAHNGYAQAQRLAKGRELGLRNNPDAVKLMREKVESYNPMTQNAIVDEAAPNGGVPSEAQVEAAVTPKAHAKVAKKATAPPPQTKEYNGVTYELHNGTWSPRE